MELDPGLTYVPWAQPLAALSAVPNPGLQFAAAPPASPLLHLPVSMCVTPMAPEPGPHTPAPQLACELPLDEDAAPSLLDKLLEERRAEEEAKDSYGCSLFIPNVC